MNEIWTTILQALEMLRNSNVKTKDIAKHFNVTRGAIDAINSGRNWKHLSENYPIRKSTRSRRNISVAKLDLKNN